MLDKIEDAFRGLIACLQVAQLYTTRHRMFGKALDKAYDGLLEVLKERAEFAIGIVGEELVFEKEIFFDLSKSVRPAILYLKDRGVEKMFFYRGVSKDDLEKFIFFLVEPREESGLTSKERLLLAGVKSIRVGKIDETQEQDQEQGSKKYVKLYDASMEKTLHTVTELLNAGSVDHLALRFTVNNLMDNLTRLPSEFMKLVSLRRHDVATYSHLLNVSILAMYFSSKLGFAKEEILDVGVAALFHDIGKLYISRKILDKPERLTDEEFTAVKSHTLLGAEILLNYQSGFGILPIVVAFEHHLKYDLTGYPRSARVRRPHLASLIVSLCDVYDALYQRRGYKVDYSPDVIHGIMTAERGTSFEPVLLDKFFKTMGVWPVGSIIALNDGRIAVVRGENEEEILLPKVEVIYPTEKKEIIDLSRAQGLKIARFLSPWKEGKEYLHLV